MKALLRRWFPNYVSIPEYVVVGLTEPQQHIKVELRGLGSPQDVTLNHTLASMRPVTISIAFDLQQDLTEIQRAHLSLAFLENGVDRKTLGEIYLAFSRAINLPLARLVLFTTTRHRNACVPLVALRFYYARRSWASRVNNSPFNFRVATNELHSLYVFYICPRPVVLVSVVHGNASNIFPMDLIGPIHSGYFLMALRTTSPAVRLMEQSRRMALSTIPDGFKDIAYDLGKHHRQETIDWDGLPFETMQSPILRLPVPLTASAIREVHVEEVHVVGSHTLFVTSVVHHQQLRDELNMFHIQGLYQQHMKNKERSLSGLSSK